MMKAALIINTERSAQTWHYTVTTQNTAYINTSYIWHWNTSISSYRSTHKAVDMYIWKGGMPFPQLHRYTTMHLNIYGMHVEVGLRCTNLSKCVCCGKQQPQENNSLLKRQNAKASNSRRRWTRCWSVRMPTTESVMRCSSLPQAGHCKQRFRFKKCV